MRRTSSCAWRRRSRAGSTSRWRGGWRGWRSGRRWTRWTRRWGRSCWCAAGGPTAAYDFTHALVRHTLYEALSPARQVRLHRDDRGGNGGGVRRPGRRARCGDRATLPSQRDLPGAERGVPYCLAAAEQAERARCSPTSRLTCCAGARPPASDAPSPRRLLGRLGLALVWALDSTMPSGCRRCGRRGLRRTEGRDEAADVPGRDCSCARRGRGRSIACSWSHVWVSTSSGERRDVTWATLKAFDIVGREAETPRRRDFRWTYPSDARSPRIFEQTGSVLAQLAVRYFASRASQRRDRGTRSAPASSRSATIVGGSALRACERRGRERAAGGSGSAGSLWARRLASIRPRSASSTEAREVRRPAVALAERLAEPSSHTAQLLAAEDEWRMATGRGLGQPHGGRARPGPEASYVARYRAAFAPRSRARMRAWGASSQPYAGSPRCFRPSSARPAWARELYAPRLRRGRDALAHRTHGSHRRHRAQPAREGDRARLPLPHDGRPPRPGPPLRPAAALRRGGRVVRQSPHRPRRAGRAPAARDRRLRRGAHVRAPRRSRRPRARAAAPRRRARGSSAPSACRAGSAAPRRC